MLLVSSLFVIIINFIVIIINIDCQSDEFISSSHGQARSISNNNNNKYLNNLKLVIHVSFNKINHELFATLGQSVEIKCNAYSIPNVTLHTIISKDEVLLI